MIHKIILPTEEGWADFLEVISSREATLLCFTKEERSYEDGAPSQVHFIGVEDGDVIYIPSFLDMDMVLAQAPEEIFLVGLSEVGKENLRTNWDKPEVLRKIIAEEYGLS